MLIQGNIANFGAGQYIAVQNRAVLLEAAQDITSQDDGGVFHRFAVNGNRPGSLVDDGVFDPLRAPTGKPSQPVSDSE